MIRLFVINSDGKAIKRPMYLDGKFLVWDKVSQAWKYMYMGC